MHRGLGRRRKLLAEHMMDCVENAEASTKRLLELIGRYSKVVACHRNRHLCTSSEQLEGGIQNKRQCCFSTKKKA